MARARDRRGRIDAAASAADGPRISASGSKAAAFVIPADEEPMMARHPLAPAKPA